MSSTLVMREGTVAIRSGPNERFNRPVRIGEKGESDAADHKLDQEG